MSYSIGIDIGGTKIASALVHKNGQIHHPQTVKTPQASKDAVLTLLHEIISSYIEIGTKEAISIDGIGIGTAGQVDSKTGTVISGTDNIADWNDVPIKTYLSSFTNLPIYIDNDANAFAVAEYTFGQGKQVDDLLCLTLGTGIGGGVFSGGRLIVGAWGGAVELGHMTVNFSGPKCNCGSRGCIETYASGTGIAARMREKLSEVETLTDETLAYYQNNPNELTSHEVFKWYREELPLAKEVIDLALSALTYGISNFIHIFNPTLIVLGGGLMTDNEFLIPELKMGLKQKGIQSLLDTVDIVPSKLGSHAGVIGAAAQVWLED